MTFLNPTLTMGRYLKGGVFAVLSMLMLGNGISWAQVPEPIDSSAASRWSNHVSNPYGNGALGQESPGTELTFIRPQISCPQDFDTLSSLLIRDIPGYTNRILQSSVGDIPSAYRPAYVIVASQPEKRPLEIRDRVYTTLPDSSQSLRQLFFTTLERQYSGLTASSISHFHWLFLAPDPDGWRMVFMFSAIDAEDEVQLPPRDSSQGSVGQAVQQWLRDCRAQAIAPENPTD